MGDTMEIKKYLEYLNRILEEIIDDEIENINNAAEIISKSILNGGKLYVFGSGHSHMIAEEIYIRAGGLALVRAILPPELMLHEMPNKSTYLERLEGYSESVLKLYKVDDKDSIIIISNSGRNIVPVEMAQKSKEIGSSVIVINSYKHTKSSFSRHRSGKKMYEFADVIIDNHAPIGDAAYYINGVDTPTGPVSDFSGIAIINALIVSIIDKLKDKDIDIPIFKSSNVDGADEYNNKLFDKYYGYQK